MLKSVDLFTGVGGITLALDGIAYPVAYCDVDEGARACIRHNIDRGLLPRAHIHEDIRTLTNPPKADIVVGGSPCVGHSARGNRLGFEESQSALFFDMLRVLDKCGARAIFIENVPQIVRNIHVVVDELTVKRKFQLRWTVVKASDLGAPHTRARWFCLGVKPGSPIETLKIDTRTAQRPVHDWSAVPPPPRTCGRKAVDAETRKRLDVRNGLMGNSVVPDAVRLGFLRLFCGGAYGDLRTHANLEFAPLARRDLLHAPPRSNHGTVTVVTPGSDDREFANAPVPLVTRRTACNLIFDPSRAPVPAVRSPLQTNETLKSNVKLTSWATPRHAMLRPCRVLTTRSLRDLPTQIKFERSTAFRATPMTAVFNEWLMGYPVGFTDVAGDGV